MESGNSLCLGEVGFVWMYFFDLQLTIGLVLLEFILQREVYSVPLIVGRCVSVCCSFPVCRS